jgi:hypothetical protein
MSYFNTSIHHKNGPRTKHVVKEPSFFIHLQLKKMAQAISMFGFATFGATTILLIRSSALDNETLHLIRSSALDNETLHCDLETSTSIIKPSS